MRRGLGARVPLTPPPARRRRVPARALALAALCAALAFLGARWLAGARAPLAAGDPTPAPRPDRELRLRDGARIALAPGARLDELPSGPSEVRLALVRGAIEAAVPAPEAHGRALEVVAAGAEIRLLGGHVRIGWVEEPPGRRLEVHVLSGRARVSRPEPAGPLTLEPGEAWSGRAP